MHGIPTPEPRAVARHLSVMLHCLARVVLLLPGTVQHSQVAATCPKFRHTHPTASHFVPARVAETDEGGEENSTPEKRMSSKKMYI